MSTVADQQRTTLPRRTKAVEKTLLADPSRRSFFRSVGVTMFGTIVSRVLGLLRDTATASLLGMSGSAVLDSLVLAFRIPNLFRGLLGEGALASSFLPEFAARLQQDRRSAGQMAVAFLRQLATVLIGLVAIGEIVCGIGWLLSDGSPERRVLLELVATTLPYLLLVCVSAQLSAMLNALGNFRIPALLPSLLNACWLIGACWLAPTLCDSPVGRARIVAVCILFGGVVQIAVQWPALRRAGIVLNRSREAVSNSLSRIWRGFAGTTIGLAITQLNTLMDCLFAWCLAATATSGATIPWLNLRYPLATGATGALYFAERMYQLPLGLIGVATATVVFPRFARHAARDDRRALSDELARSLKFTFLLALPAGIGLMLLAEPIARLLFEHGEFTQHDSRRTAAVISAYAAGAWAYCLLPVIVRGFYAVGDRRTPILVGAVSMLINLTLDLTLVWPLAEVGLATATAVSASAQVVLLCALFSRRHVRLNWGELRSAALRIVFATVVMAAAVWATRSFLSERISLDAGGSFASRLLLVAVPMGVGAMVFAGISLGLWQRPKETSLA